MRKYGCAYFFDRCQSQDIAKREIRVAARSCTDYLLLQLEEAQGGADEQARAQLDKLRQQTASLSSIQTQTQRAASTAPAVDELVLAGQLDK